MKTTPRTAFLLCLSTAAALAGCGPQIEVEDPRLAEAASELFRAESCPDLELRLREDALARIDQQMDAYLLIADQFDGGDSIGFGRGDDMAGGDASSDDGGGEVASGTGTGGGNEDGGAPAAAPPDHSGTNNQVEGVDEADIVKTDGNRLYVLSGTAFTVLDAWPASALAVAQSLPLEGTPLEMFVEGDKAVIFAQVDGTGVYAAAGVTPKAPYHGGGYYGGDGFAGEDCYDCYGPQNLLTQVLVLDLAAGIPSVEREFFFEGSYLSSRREGDQVRIVLNGGAHFPGADEYPMCADDGCNSSDDWIEAVETARQRAKLRVYQTSLADYVPYRFQRGGGAVTLLDDACTGYWVPTAGSSEYGLTQVEGIDLGNLAAQPSHTAIVGAAQTVYANESTLILAGTSYDTSRFIGYGVATPEPVVLNSSFLHRFDLDVDPSQPTYTGTTTVPGYLIDQFAMDERDGVLRVATHVTEMSDVAWSESNALFTVDTASNTILGSVEGLAEGEQMYSVRFVGDRGYFVTFRQTDPLFVFDISNPAAPVKTGELHIPGFSEYMHPLDDAHLLTIGYDGEGDGLNGQLALQVFDVRDATNPILKHKMPLEAGSSEALYNHKAFTFWRDMLAIPFESWSNADGTYSTELALFSVDVDSGITEKGRIDHSQFYELGSEYNYCFPGGVRRGVFIEDFVYSVSSGGVAVHDLADLETPVASVSLPEFDAASYCNGYY